MNTVHYHQHHQDGPIGCLTYTTLENLEDDIKSMTVPIGTDIFSIAGLDYSTVKELTIETDDDGGDYSPVNIPVEILSKMSVLKSLTITDTVMGPTSISDILKYSRATYVTLSGLDLPVLDVADIVSTRDCNVFSITLDYCTVEDLVYCSYPDMYIYININDCYIQPTVTFIDKMGRYILESKCKTIFNITGDTTIL